MKLPKGLKDHPSEPKIAAWLTADLRLLRSDGSLHVPTLVWSPQVESALKRIQASGHLLQGLDQIDREMRKELHGLKQVADKGGSQVPDRLSRLLILASDGSDRFYHNAESIQAVHKERMAVCVTTADSLILGAALSRKKQPLKALLITDRKALEGFLAQIFS